MGNVDRRTILRVAGAGVGAAAGAGAGSAGDTSVESEASGGQLETVSSLTADISRLGFAFDTDDPSTVEEILASDLPEFEQLAEVNANIGPSAQWTATSVATPDLVDLIAAVGPKQYLVTYLEQLDIQQDIIDAYTLDELQAQLVDFLEQLDVDETQAAAIGDLLNAVQQEFGIELPLDLKLGDVVENILLEPATEIENLFTLLGIETMTDLVEFIIGSIDGVSTIDGLEQYLVDTASGLDLSPLFDSLSVGLEFDAVGGQFDPRLGDPVQMTLALDSVTLLPEVTTGTASAAPGVEIPLGVTLTTGETGQRTGSITLDPAAGDGGEGQATPVDNEFVLGVDELDFVSIVEGLDLVALLESLLAGLGIDPADYEWTVSQLVEDMDIPALVENADIPGLIDGVITDEPGRHVFEADLEMGFSDLESVLELDLPGALPGGSLPQDLDGDGLFEDIDGDGTFDIFDVQALFSNLQSGPVQNNPGAFDFDGDGQVDIFDVQTLFSRL